MSDALRKDTTDQAKEKITPDSQKSTLDQAKESVTGTADRIAGSLQPGKFHSIAEGEKSTTQKVSDSTRSGTDSASENSKGVLQQAQDSISSATQSVSDTLSG
ncbi:MAG: hypothetical protein M1820_002159, partial [Bogoriella megaspora]